MKRTMIPFKKLSRAKQIERWEQAKRVLKGLTPHERRQHFDMSVFGERTSCGTVACAAGHCGLDPWFNRRGLVMEFRPEKNTWKKIDSETGEGLEERVITDYVAKDNFDVDVERFFGPRTNMVFFVGGERTVPEVIREIEGQIREMKGGD